MANHFTLAVDRVNRELGILGATRFQAKVSILLSLSSTDMVICRYDRIKFCQSLITGVSRQTQRQLQCFKIL